MAATGEAPKFSESPALTLNDLGVTHDQSSEWQKLAAIPAAEFEEAVEQAAAEAADTVFEPQGRLNLPSRSAPGRALTSWRCCGGRLG